MSKDKITGQPATAPRNTMPPLFGMVNYILFLAGILFIVFGFVLMSGGGSDDPNVFNPDVFSPRRITVAPLLVMLGFAVTVAAIMFRKK